MNGFQSDCRVAIIGGGLAGMAAAAVLCQQGFEVELFEARQQLGGRAGSFRDPQTGELIDHCQHVGMGCCTNLRDFCRRTAIDGLFQRHKVLYFFGPDGRCFEVQGFEWLPAPLHLAPVLLRVPYLSWRERLGILTALLQLARTGSEDSPDQPTIGQWLRQHDQTDRSIERFWSVILVSALGETIDRASLSAARKVFVDGFMVHRQAYYVEIPTVPLGELYGRRVAQWLLANGTVLHLGRPVAALEDEGDTVRALKLQDGQRQVFDQFLVAVPWRRAAELLPEQVVKNSPALRSISRIQSSPITSVHLWLDRSITPLPHAVLVDRLSQWVFNRGEQRAPGNASAAAYYYQVVISASRSLSGRDKAAVLEEVLQELRSIWPAARRAQLVHGRVVTERDAVFSPVPGLAPHRPSQKTAISNLFLAGDWTDTGWPSTMEGAVRSGYLAAEAICVAAGGSERALVSDLPRGWLAKWLL